MAQFVAMQNDSGYLHSWSILIYVVADWILYDFEIQTNKKITKYHELLGFLCILTNTIACFYKLSWNGWWITKIMYIWSLTDIPSRSVVLQNCLEMRYCWFFFIHHSHQHFHKNNQDKCKYCMWNLIITFKYLLYCR